MKHGPKSIETHEDLAEDGAGGRNRSISLKRTEEQKDPAPLQKIKTDYEDVGNASRGAPGLRLSQTSKSAEQGRKEGEARASISKPAINTLSLAKGEEKKAEGPQILLMQRDADAGPYEALDMLAKTHHEKNVPVASSAELSQAHSELGGIAEPLHRPLDAKTKSEIVSELSRIQSESFFNVPQLHEKLEKPNPSKVYFTGAANGEPRDEAESSLGLPGHGKTEGQLSSANLTSSKQATLTAIV